MGKFHRNFVALMLVLLVLTTSMAESFFVTSLRYLVTLVFAYYLGVCLVSRNLKIPRNIYLYLGFVTIYTLVYYLVGSGNNLIVHLLTICYGVAGLYMVMLKLKFDIFFVWRYVILFWVLMLVLLAVELILAIFGYQELLSNLFPESNRVFGLPAYRSIYNSFGSHFELGFDGLNTVSLQVQAYGQFCIMLTILGFSYMSQTLKISRLSKCFWFLLVPLALYTSSPNITAAVMFAFIIGYVLFVKFYIGIYSTGRLLVAFAVLASSMLVYYLGNFGFVRSYPAEDLYDLFIAKQFEYIYTIPLSDYIIGVGLQEYYDLAPAFEIAYLSYLSVSGLVFGGINLYLLINFTTRSFRQIKSLNLIQSRFLLAEIQAANLLFVLSMFLSSIHFPVITSYLGSGIFIFHLAFGMYILKAKPYPMSLRAY
jgi:hypothetical protein